MISRRVLLASLPACALAGEVRAAPSDEWPQRPVRILVPFAAGGNSDFIARVIAQRLSEVFAKPFVVECRPGAAGVLAAEAAAHAAPDGYTLFLGTPSQVSIAPLVSKTPYDPVKDFAPISVIGTNPKVWAIHAGVPVDTFVQFADYVRRRPRQLAYADTGVGSISHLSTELVLKRADMQMVPVSYKGQAQATTDLVAGRISTIFTNVSDVLPYVTAGSLKLLAVADDKRSPQLPHVPTFAQVGLPGLVITTWNGLMAPAGTPRAIIDRVAQEVARAVKDPTIAKRLSGAGVDPVGGTPAEFAAMIATDIPLWTEAVKIAGVEAKD